MSDDQRRAIGKIVSVSADRFVVELHGRTDNFTVVGFDDVHYVARLGSFVMIPIHAEYVVAEVIGLRERDLIGSSQSTSSGEVDKAASAKFLDLVPVGMLPQQRDGRFRFGISIYPSLYSDALYALDEELDRIFEVSDSEAYVPQPPEGCGDGTATWLQALTIGGSAVFQGYEVKVRIDEFFGSHVAILGNTGSGKSCTVATILQSLFSKQNPHQASGSTFLFLDVNGEYRQAFSRLPNSINRLHLKVTVDPEDPDHEPLDDGEITATFRLPHWFLSVEEWELLLRASERTQQPVLRMALGLTSLFSQSKTEKLKKLKNHLLACCIQSILQSDVGSGAKKDRIVGILSMLSTDEINADSVRDHISISYGTMADSQRLMDKLNEHILERISLPGYANTEFTFEQLETAIDLALLYEEAHGNRQIRDYCSQMITRLKWIRERQEFAFLTVSPGDLKASEMDEESFVERFLGLERLDGVYKKAVQIIILDMNEAADEVVEVTAAVMARLVFDRLRTADPRNRFPVNLVLEEAHRYVAQNPSRYAIDASRIFERIAKEGRKYGMFLLVASQRPSELSTTVLSQCSNFLIHRIQNPDDLNHIRQMTPFISESVLRRLPSLPRQHALIFGNGVNLPTTLRVRDVDPRPKSDDAAIRELWFRPPESVVELEIRGAD